MYNRPTYLCTVDQTFNNVWLKTRAQYPTERKHTAARVQHCNNRDRHGSGALPDQGHLQATAISKQRRGLDPIILGDPQQHIAAAQQRKGLDPRTLGYSQQNKTAKQQRGRLDPRTLGDSQTTKERTSSQEIEGFSKQTTMAAPADEEATALAATQRFKPQHLMATMPHMKSGNTSSQHTWVYKTPFTQGCLGWKNKQRNK